MFHRGGGELDPSRPVTGGVGRVGREVQPWLDGGIYGGAGVLGGIGVLGWVVGRVGGG